MLTVLLARLNRRLEGPGRRARALPHPADADVSKGQIQFHRAAESDEQQRWRMAPPSLGCDSVSAVELGA
jgi:uncharacterized protein YifN (PemK superfamily)